MLVGSAPNFPDGIIVRAAILLNFPAEQAGPDHTPCCPCSQAQDRNARRLLPRIVLDAVPGPRWSGRWRREVRL